VIWARRTWLDFDWWISATIRSFEISTATDDKDRD
jgi:hypothetical protein